MAAPADLEDGVGVVRVTDRRSRGTEDRERVQRRRADVAESVLGIGRQEDAVPDAERRVCIVDPDLGIALDDRDQLLHLEVGVRWRAEAWIAPLLDHAERRRLGRVDGVEPSPDARTPLDERRLRGLETDWSDHSGLP